jgi:hypothetical protein
MKAKQEKLSLNSIQSALAWKIPAGRFCFAERARPRVLVSAPSPKRTLFVAR